MTKRKEDCTPEEWVEIRARARKSDAKQRRKPSRVIYMKDYMASYTRTKDYRERDNARYNEDRRQKQLKKMRERTYGADAALVGVLREIQQNKCPLCQRTFLTPEAKQRNKGDECLDHDHETKKVRGLLCRMCNTFEGFLKKHGVSPTEFGERLQRYLDNPPASGADLI